MNWIIPPPAELAQVPSGVIVTPGVPCPHANVTEPVYNGGNVTCNYGTRRCKDCGATRDDWSPWPVVLIADPRWTALEGPCETCAGTGKIIHPKYHTTRNVSTVPCPNCINGRKKVELRNIHPARRKLPGDHPLADDLYVLVARASVAVLPVYSKDDPDSLGRFVAEFWPFDPVPVPGRDFVVVLSDVEMAAEGSSSVVVPQTPPGLSVAPPDAPTTELDTP